MKEFGIVEGFFVSNAVDWNKHLQL